MLPPENVILRLEDIKVAKRPKNKMPIADRAKQFMPFAALKGLPEALSAREKIIVSKIELSPEMADELNLKMCQLELGKLATVVYFCKDEYIKISGMVSRIDETSRILQIVSTKIPFDDILDVELQETSTQNLPSYPEKIIQF